MFAQISIVLPAAAAPGGFHQHIATGAQCPAPTRTTKPQKHPFMKQSPALCRGSLPSGNFFIMWEEERMESVTSGHSFLSFPMHPTEFPVIPIGSQEGWKERLAG